MATSPFVPPRHPSQAFRVQKLILIGLVESQHLGCFNICYEKIIKGHRCKEQNHFS